MSLPLIDRTGKGSEQVAVFPLASFGVLSLIVKALCHCFMHHSKTFLSFILMLNMEIIFISLAVAASSTH